MVLTTNGRAKKNVEYLTGPFSDGPSSTRAQNTGFDSTGFENFSGLALIKYTLTPALIECCLEKNAALGSAE